MNTFSYWKNKTLMLKERLPNMKTLLIILVTLFLLSFAKVASKAFITVPVKVQPLILALVQ